MAPFEKYIPTENENYLGYSKGVEGPKPNLALAKLFSGVAETSDAAIKGGTQVLDQTIEDTARDNLNTSGVGSDVGVTPEQGATFGKMKNKLDAGDIFSGASAGPPLPGVAEQEISNLDKMYQKYKAGELNPTYYLLKQQAVAQQLKQRFPGSEDQIDARIHKETSSANTIRSQLYSDFQAAATQANSAAKDWQTFVRSKGDILGEQGTQMALTPGVFGDKLKQFEITAFIAKQEKSVKDMTTRHAEINLQVAQNSLDTSNAERGLTLDLNGIISRAASGALSPLSPLQKSIDDAAKTGQFTPEFIRSANAQITEMERALDAQFDAHINNPQFQGQSYASLLKDPAKISALRNQAKENLLHLKDAINNNQTGLVGYFAKNLEMQKDKSASDLLDNSETARAIAGTEKALGGQGNIVNQIILNNQNKGPGGSTTVLSQIWKDVLNKSTANTVNGKSTIAEVVQKQEGKDPPPQVPKQTIQNTIQIISDPASPLEMKKRGVQYLTGDTDGQFFKKLSKDSQLQAFNTLTSEKVTKSVFELQDPQLWNDYKSWTQRIANTQFMARAGDVRALVNNPQLGLEYNPETNQLVWNQNTGQLGVPNSSGLFESPRLSTPYPELTAAVQMNNTLRNLGSVYEKDKTDVTKSIAPLLQGMGVPIANPEVPSKKSNFEDATRTMGLNEQEQNLYKRHLTNLYGPGGVDNPDGSRSSLYQVSFEHNGRTYNVPSVYDGKILKPDKAIDRAFEIGLDKFPSYGSQKEAEDRYDAMHGYMDKDTATYLKTRKSALPYAPEKQTPEAIQAINTILQSALEKGKPDAHITNMSPELKTGLASMLKDAPKGVEIFSGHRTEERQKQLFDAAVAKYGSVAAARRWVAPPGYSRHNTGNAADLRFASNEARQWVHDNAAKYGLHFPLSNEPWHIEPVGARNHP